MREVTGEVYTLSYKELEILADFLGKDAIFRLEDEENNKNINKEEIIQLLYEMKKKEILKVEEEKIKINALYQELIEDICDVKYGLVITASDSALPQKCCYIGKNILVTEIMRVKKNKIRMERVTFSSFIEMLLCEGYLPDILTEDTMMLEEIEKENADKEQVCYITIDKAAEDILQQCKAMVVFELFDLKSSERQGVLTIMEEGYLYGMQIETYHEQKKIFYSLERFQEELKHMKEME